MKKLHHIIATLALAIIASAAFSAAAQSIQSGEFSYVIDGNTLKIVKYTGNAESLTIPDSVDGYRVKTIGDSVFYGNKTLKNIDLGKGISIIGSHAFYESGLVNIEIPTNVTVIGLRAFSNSDLKRVYIEDSATPLVLVNIVEQDSVKCYYHYGYNPFSGNRLERYYIGRNLLSDISGEYSLMVDCSTMVLGEKVTKFQASYSINYETHKKAKIIALNRNIEVISGGEIVSAVTEFNEMAGRVYIGSCRTVSVGQSRFFCDLLSNSTYKYEIIDADIMPNQNLDLTLPHYLDNGTLNRIVGIGKNAFYNLSGLHSVVIPNQYNYMMDMDSAFAQCKNLTNVVLSDSIEQLEYTFIGCSSLEKINLNTPCLKIIYGAFTNCTSLKEVELGDNVVNTVRAFQNCTNLETVKLGKHVTWIGEYAFYGCRSLKK